MRQLSQRLRSDQQGATAIEYGLILALVALFAIIAIGAFSSAAMEKWTLISDEVTENSSGG